MGAPGAAPYDLDGGRRKGQPGSQSTANLQRVGAEGAASRNDALGRSSAQRGPNMVENNSEINYGVNNNAIERSYGRRNDNKLDIDRPDSHLNGPLEYQNDILKGDSISKASVNSKSVANIEQVKN